MDLFLAAFVCSSLRTTPASPSLRFLSEHCPLPGGEREPGERGPDCGSTPPPPRAWGHRAEQHTVIVRWLQQHF